MRRGEGKGILGGIKKRAEEASGSKRHSSTHHSTRIFNKD
jgi:hypothetical protein